jgi:hypothetical protein
VTDPDEIVNRIDDPAYAEVKRDMRERMWRHIQELGDPIARGFDVRARRRGK